jgi:hypothetical protein
MNHPKFNEAEKLIQQTKPAPVINDYELDQLAFRANYEQLKAARLAREATQQ